METWYKMLATQLLILLIMLISGKRFSKQPPKSINNFFGIRTNMSMKNKDTWEFAHKLAGKLMWKWGWICLGILMAVMALIYGQPDALVEKTSMILLISLLVPFLGITVYTDRQLRKHFHEDGTRRQL